MMYKKVKISIYSLFYVILCYFYFKEGIKDFTHTPPPAFLVGSIILIISFFWLIFDYVLSNILKLYNISIKIHFNSIYISFIICLIIIFFSFF